jgi:hypothetical protein
VPSEPTNEELLTFARSLIGDTEPFLDTKGLERGIAEHRELWLKLCRLDAELDGLELKPQSTSR